jgi:hypothetical protein
MLQNCAKSCGSCDELVGKTKTTTAVHSMNDSDHDILIEKTVKYGEKQTATGEEKSNTLAIIQDMLQYMESSDEFMALPTKIQENCRNQNKLCSFWAAIGECHANMAYMNIQCAPGMGLCLCD